MKYAIIYKKIPNNSLSPTKNKTRLWLSAVLLGLTVSVVVLQVAPQASHLLAAVYSGGGITSGVDQVSGVSGGSLRGTIAKIVNKALNFVALLAVASIIVAGFYLILSFGSDSSKETAKKTVIYTSIGLLLILLSKAIVNLVIEAGS